MKKVHTLSNDFLTISVQHEGAELCSIVSGKTGREYMWEGNPDSWGSFAPVLFPIIGSLKNGTYFFQGKSYSIPKHGFIRHNKNLKFNQLSQDCFELSLKYDSESLKIYPFKFEFFIRFSLVDSKIFVEHEIINHSAEESLFFSVGGHPAFKCPFNEDEKYDDYYLEFEKSENAETWEVLPDGLINSTTKPLLSNTSVLRLTENLFDNDALIFKDLKSKRVSLKSTKSTQSVTVEFLNFPYLGIWAKPKGKFVCIEPWQGISDSVDTNQDFSKKEGMIELESGGTSKMAYTIIIEE